MLSGIGTELRSVAGTAQVAVDRTCSMQVHRSHSQTDRATTDHRLAVRGVRQRHIHVLYADAKIELWDRAALANCSRGPINSSSRYIYIYHTASILYRVDNIFWYRYPYLGLSFVRLPFHPKQKGMLSCTLQSFTRTNNHIDTPQLYRLLKGDCIVMPMSLIIISELGASSAGRCVQYCTVAGIQLGGCWIWKRKQTALLVLSCLSSLAHQLRVLQTSRPVLRFRTAVSARHCLAHIWTIM